MVKKKTGKTTGKTSGKRGAKQGPEAAAWSSFTFVTVCTLIVFWVLFPFYSYQLQIIFDQKDGGGYNIPAAPNEKPYQPKGGEEKVLGPDMFTAFINSFGDILKQLYQIITGVVWIEIDKSITKMEHGMHPGKVEESDSGEQTGEEKEPASVSLSDPVTEAIHGIADYEKAVSEQGGGALFGRKMGANKAAESSKAVNIAMKLLKEKLHINRKNFVNMACCNKPVGVGRMSDFYGEDIKQKCDLAKEDGGFLCSFPMKYITPSEFGWPYTYLFNEKNASGPPIKTQYDPNGKTDEKSMQRWIGAWFGKTQQRSWSTMRCWWSKILKLFLPFLEDDVSADDIEKDLDMFIKAIEAEINKRIDKDLKNKSQKGGMPARGDGTDGVEMTHNLTTQSKAESRAESNEGEQQYQQKATSASSDTSEGNRVQQQDGETNSPGGKAEEKADSVEEKAGWRNNLDLVKRLHVIRKEFKKIQEEFKESVQPGTNLKPGDARILLFEKMKNIIGETAETNTTENKNSQQKEKALPGIFMTGIKSMGDGMSTVGTKIGSKIGKLGDKVKGLGNGPAEKVKGWRKRRQLARKAEAEKKVVDREKYGLDGGGTVYKKERG